MRWKIKREWFLGTTLLDLLWVFGYAVLIIGIVEDFVFFLPLLFEDMFFDMEIPISCFKSTPPIGLGPISLVVRRRALILSARMVEVNLSRRKMAKDP